MSRSSIGLCLVVVLGGVAASAAADGNRFTYLDEFCDPYYVGRNFPKLITPQWVGEVGVEAVVVLAIDDMRDPVKYEAYLRPILERLKQIDGRAPLSIMTCKADPADPQLQTWIKEGLSIEIHTADHPCPLLQGGDFGKAKSTYDRCVDQMNLIPGNKPVAFRMPCCDSLNTPSPRFWTEIFNRTTEQGNFLQIDTSVFNITTASDTNLPRELVFDPDGQERFRKYLPFPSFVNTIEDYPYPYVIAGRCWEFPCIVPSDWEAQHLLKPNNPQTVADMQAALDAVVLKQGAFNLVFHPHGWIRNDQIVELIDHAVAKHGQKVKFLTFRDCAERISSYLLDSYSLRNANGQDGGASVADVNADGFADVIIRDGDTLNTKVWVPEFGQWRRFSQSVRVDDLRLGICDELTCLVMTDDGLKTRLFTDGWQETSFELSANVSDDWKQRLGDSQWLRGARPVFRDLDDDGDSELLITHDTQSETLILNRSSHGGAWEALGFTLPTGVRLSAQGQDAGLRFVDDDEDGFDDILFSDSERYALHLWKDMQAGWAIQKVAGTRGQEGGVGPVIPPIVRPDGTNNGVWFHSRTMWVQNEDTNRLPDLVQRLSFDDMLQGRVE